jgi:hypothetical protein
VLPARKTRRENQDLETNDHKGSWLRCRIVTEVTLMCRNIKALFNFDPPAGGKWDVDAYIALCLTSAYRNPSRQFMREGIGQKHDPTFSGGGLVRSHSGWSQVLSQRRKNQKEAYDERILGSGDFVHAVIKETEEKQLRQIKLRRKGLTLDRIIEQEVKKSRISIQELKTGSRRKAASETRAKIAARAVTDIGASCAEIARHLGVCTSSISRVVAKGAEGHGK